MTAAVEGQNFISPIILFQDFVQRRATRFWDMQEDDCLGRRYHLTGQTLQDAIGHEQLSVRRGRRYLVGCLGSSRFGVWRLGFDDSSTVR